MASEQTVKQQVEAIFALSDEAIRTKASEGPIGEVLELLETDKDAAHKMLDEMVNTVKEMTKSGIGGEQKILDAAENAVNAIKGGKVNEGLRAMVAIEPVFDASMTALSEAIEKEITGLLGENAHQLLGNLSAEGDVGANALKDVKAAIEKIDASKPGFKTLKESLNKTLEGFESATPEAQAEAVGKIQETLTKHAVRDVSFDADAVSVITKKSEEAAKAAGATVVKTAESLLGQEATFGKKVANWYKRPFKKLFGGEAAEILKVGEKDAEGVAKFVTKELGTGAAIGGAAVRVAIPAAIGYGAIKMLSGGKSQEAESYTYPANENSEPKSFAAAEDARREAASAGIER